MGITRRALLLAAQSGLCLCGTHAAEGAALRRWEGPSDAPPIDLLRPDGSPLSLRDLRGKVVLVNFWASWCEPCLAEMPSLQRLCHQLGAERFEVLGVNYQEGLARINAFVQKTGVTFPIVRDTDGAIARAWSARVFPSSYILDRAGQIRYLLVGEADWTSPAIVSTIRSLLRPPPPPR